jgi:hypothetical protein
MAACWNTNNFIRFDDIPFLCISPKYDLHGPLCILVMEQAVFAANPTVSGNKNKSCLQLSIELYPFRKIEAAI